MSAFASAAMAQDKYVKVTTEPTDWSGDYLIVYEDGNGNVAFNGGLETLDIVSNTIQVVISENSIEANEVTNAAKFTIAAVEGGYSVKAANGKYIGQTSDANGLKAQDSYLINSISLDSEGNSEIISILLDSDGNPIPSARLRYNATINELRFRYYKSATYTVQKAIQLYKFNGTTSSLSAPTISATATAFEEKTTITITADEGADIYYTLNGSEPTTESTKYTEPFDVTESLTVKAIAVKDGEESDVKELEVKKIGTITLGDAAAWVNTQDAKNVANGDVYRVTPDNALDNAKVLYVNGNKIFVRQGEVAFTLYKFPENNTVKANSVLSGSFVAQLVSYYGIFEFSSTELTNWDNITVAPSEEDAAPKTVIVKNIFYRGQLSDKVKLENVFLEKDGETYYATKGGFKTKIEAWDEGVEKPTDIEDKLFDIVAIVSNTEKNHGGCLTVLSIEEKGTATVSKPEFSIAGGSIAEGTIITISTKTEGATIYYTTNGQIPTTGSTEYTDGVIAEAGVTEIKAIAVKDGEESDIASISITVVEAYSLSQFKALQAGTEGLLQFSNAVIKYIYAPEGKTPEVYIASEDGTGLLLYMKDFPVEKYATGNKISGSVWGKSQIYNGKHEVTEVKDKTNYDNIIVVGKGSTEAIKVTAIAAQADKYAEALVQIDGYIKVVDNKVCIVDEATDVVATLEVYNAFKLNDYPELTEWDGKPITIKGIITHYVSTSKDTWEICPTANPTAENATENATAVRAIDANAFDENAPIYNLQGQRVSKGAKGILIQNGKKYLVK